jgi:hypothetical protein
VDIGARLFATINDVTLVGLALHPVYKRLQLPNGVPAAMAHDHGRKNPLKFFCEDLQARMKVAILRELVRLGVKRGADAAPSQQVENVMHMLVPGLRRVEQNQVRRSRNR